jgi:phage-related holin
MFLLRCLAGCIVWISIIGSIVALAGIGIIFYINSGQISSITTSTTYMGMSVPQISSNSQYVQYYAYGAWSLAGLLLLILLCLCNRIRLAVAVCKCAGKFIV